MKKVLLLLIALMPLAMMAEQRTAGEAQSLATDYLRAKAARHMLGVNAHAPSLKLAMTATNDAKQVDYYVFNNSVDQGFIVIAGDDKAVPVLGYSDEGTFDADYIPDGLQYMLDCYAEQMQYLRSHPLSAAATEHPQFDISVTPLLTCNWNQNAPFNDMCPTYGAENTHAASGCVATAAAQIMYHHKWPQQGTGSHSYICNVNQEGEQTLSADFNTTYDWDNMLDQYMTGWTAQQGSAVAKLLYHVGVAADMEYGSSSSASPYAMMECMRNNFGYNKAMRLNLRGLMNIAQWDSLIQEELRNSRPMVYTGYTPRSGGGHTFVLDGCNADGYYHFNWGWGGRSNGYFLITVLNPRDQGIGSFEGGYNAAQSMVTGIYPDQGEPAPEKYFEIFNEYYKAGVDQVNLGEIAPIEVATLIINGYGYGLKTAVYIGFCLTNEAGQRVDFTSQNCYNYNLFFGSRYKFLMPDHPLHYTPSSTLADGNYKLWLMYKEPTSMSNYLAVPHGPTFAGYISAKVENGVMHFSVPEAPAGDLMLYNFSAPDCIGTGSPFNVNATIVNQGDEYYDNVYFAIFKDGETEMIADGIQVDIKKGGRVSFKSSLTAPSQPGEYELVVLDKNLSRIGTSLTLQVVNSSNENLTIVTPLQVYDFYMEVDNVGGTAVIGNSGTVDYVGPIQYMILNDDGSSVRQSGNTDVVTIPAGGSQEVNIKTVFEGIPGLTYNLCLRNLRYPNTFSIWGDMKSFQLNSPPSTTTLAKIIADGYAAEYMVADNLTIVDTHAPSVFATDGFGSWIELKCGEYFSAVNAMKALKAGTVKGNYAVIDGNPSITLLGLPEAGNEQEVGTMVDLSQTFTPVATQVIDFSGFYFVENGTPVIRAYDGADGDLGARVEISTQWLSTTPAFVQGNCYTLRGVAMSKPTTSGNPLLRAQGGANFDNFVVYLTKAPDVVTAVSNIADDHVGIGVASGVLTVTGAKRIKVYNAAGALVSTSAITRLPAGVYIVVADAKCQKVLVR